MLKHGKFNAHMSGWKEDMDKKKKKKRSAGGRGDMKRKRRRGWEKNHISFIKFGFKNHNETRDALIKASLSASIPPVCSRRQKTRHISSFWNDTFYNSRMYLVVIRGPSTHTHTHTHHHHHRDKKPSLTAPRSSFTRHWRRFMCVSALQPRPVHWRYSSNVGCIWRIWCTVLIAIAA